MSKFDKYTRVNKFEKRRKNTKAISILLLLASILIIFLIILFVFGDKDEKAMEPKDQSKVEQTEGKDETETDNSAEDGNEDIEKRKHEDKLSDVPSKESQVETEPVDSEDENVIKAYTGNWDPVGTKQEGPHTTKYDEGTQDRTEIEKAVLVATGLDESNLATWWVGNGGDQKVIATVSDNDKTEIYRVYLSWIDNQGWQPTKVEVLKEVEY